MRKNYINIFMKYLLIAMCTFVIFARPDNSFANLINITGTWDSNWGKMELEQRENSVWGTYATSNGKIFATLQGNILKGYWTQSSSGRKCSTKKYGSYYWGRVKFVFDSQNKRFNGSWGYCENVPNSGGWRGTKKY